MQISDTEYFKIWDAMTGFQHTRVMKEQGKFVSKEMDIFREVQNHKITKQDFIDRPLISSVVEKSFRRTLDKFRWYPTSENLYNLIIASMKLGYFKSLNDNCPEGLCGDQVECPEKEEELYKLLQEALEHLSECCKAERDIQSEK